MPCLRLFFGPQKSPCLIVIRFYHQHFVFGAGFFSSGKVFMGKGRRGVAKAGKKNPLRFRAKNTGDGVCAFMCKKPLFCGFPLPGQVAQAS